MCVGAQILDTKLCSVRFLFWTLFFCRLGSALASDGVSVAHIVLTTDLPDQETIFVSIASSVCVIAVRRRRPELCGWKEGWVKGRSKNSFN